MEGKRRTIELDEAVAVALEERAAERGMSLDAHLADLALGGLAEIDIPPEDLAELDARIVEWERARDDLSAHGVFDRLIRRAEGAARQNAKAHRD